jgi:S-layer homology domain
VARWAKAASILLLTLSWALSSGLPVSRAAAATAIVTNGNDVGSGSLRQAIADAAPGDTITFAPNVTTVTLTTAELAIAKDLTIQGNSQDTVLIERSIESGTPEFRIFHITAGTVSISGLSIAQGKTFSDSLSDASQAGGGLRVSGGSLELADSVVRDNRATLGGGLAVVGPGTLTIARSVVQDNSAYFGGGIISYRGNATLTQTTVSENQGSEGGGLSTYQGTLSLSDTSVVGNTSNGPGGGISNREGLVSLVNVTVRGNTAQSGGGIESFDVSDSLGGDPNLLPTTNLTNVTISGNSAVRYGGGIGLGLGQATLANVTISGNSSNESAGMVSYSAVVTLDNVTITGNNAQTSSGFALFGSASYPTNAHIQNSIIVGNANGDCAKSSASDAPLISDGYNVVGPGCPSDNAGDLTFTGTLSDLLDPNLVDNGGPTPTHALVPASPALDRIPIAQCGASTDQRGIARPQGPGCDSGAYETVVPLPQEITFNPLPDWSTDNPSFVMSATGGDSGNPLVFGTTTPSVCTVGTPATATSATVTILASGSCTLTADQPGNSVYTPAPQAQLTFTLTQFPCARRFTDVLDTDSACAAIAALTEKGTISGYATTPPTFGPGDNVQRAQMAAFIVRALAWQDHPTGPHAFSDFGALFSELRTASLILANACDESGNHCVIQGYGDGRFGPTDQITYAQAVTLIARAFELDGTYRWSPQPNATQPYSGVPSVHDEDIRTYVHHAGAIPDAPTTATDWNTPAPRAWVARILFQALQSTP